MPARAILSRPGPQTPAHYHCGHFGADRALTSAPPETQSPPPPPCAHSCRWLWCLSCFGDCEHLTPATVQLDFSPHLSHRISSGEISPLTARKATDAIRRTCVFSSLIAIFSSGGFAAAPFVPKRPIALIAEMRAIKSESPSATWIKAGMTVSCSIRNVPKRPDASTFESAELSFNIESSPGTAESATSRLVAKADSPLTHVWRMIWSAFVSPEPSIRPQSVPPI